MTIRASIFVWNVKLPATLSVSDSPKPRSAGTEVIDYYKPPQLAKIYAWNFNFKRHKHLASKLFCQ